MYTLSRHQLRSANMRDDDSFFVCLYEHFRPVSPSLISLLPFFYSAITFVDRVNSTYRDARLYT